jgi:hypothetical protein
VKRTNKEKYEETLRHFSESIETDQEGFFAILCGRPLNPTQRSFIFDTHDSENFPRDIRGFGGAAGAGKTTAAFALMLATAAVVPGFRGGIGRYDYNKLEKMNIPDLDKMLGRAPRKLLIDRSKSAPMVWTIANGGEPSTIMFLNLKEYPGGLELNWMHIEEASELPDSDAVDALWSRLRSPDPYDLQARLTMTFNPPPKSHWLYPACTGRDMRDRPDRKIGGHPWVKWYRPRPRENAHNLRRGYYEEMEKSTSMSEAERASKLDGNFGSTFEGEPVYREFKPNLHVRPVRFISYLPLLRFWDFGYRTPVCLWAQCDEKGGLTVLKEEIGENVEAYEFAMRCKTQTAQQFPSAKSVLDWGDPAVRQVKDTGSALADYARAGITIQYDPGITIEKGVKVLRQRLSTLIEGEAAFLIHPDCVLTIEAFKGGYKLGKVLSATGEPEPVKDGVYDHPMDALRYGVWGLFGGGRAFNPAAYAKGGSDFPDSLEYNSAHDYGG